jgi:hypothetical protein
MAQVVACYGWAGERRGGRWPQRQAFIDCLEAIMRESILNSRTTANAVAAGGGAQLRVLDFKFLSRTAPPSKQ